MSVKNIISITEARNNIFKITDQIQKDGARFILTENGRPKAVIMSVEEFDSWQETVEIMSNPELMKEIESADEDYKKGNYITLEEMLNKEGFVLADKSKNKYVSNRSKKSGAKKLQKNRQKI